MAVPSPPGLPEWVQWFAALAPAGAAVVTASAATAVGIIAYRQWRVAREKLVLDLFEKRFTWYFDYRSQILNPLDNTGDAIIQSYLEQSRLADESRFLFGLDVSSRLAPVLSALQTLVMKNDGAPVVAAEVRDAKQQYIALVGPLSSDLPKLVLPYMKMHQRL